MSLTSFLHIRGYFDIVNYSDTNKYSKSYRTCAQLSLIIAKIILILFDFTLAIVMLMWSVHGLTLMLRQTSSAMVQLSAYINASTRFTAARAAGGQILSHHLKYEFRYQTVPLQSLRVPSKNARGMITLVKLLSVGETSFISITCMSVHSCVYMHKTGITNVHGHGDITTNKILTHSWVCVCVCVSSG